MKKKGDVSPDLRVFEVGARDGLQNTKASVALEDKLFLIRGLIAAGIQDLELGAFVRKDKVPQMADTDEIFEKIGGGELDLGAARAWSLVPNMKGLERARAVGAKHIAVFTAATESFATKNIGMSIDESLKVFSGVIQEAKSFGIQVRGYVSTAFGCPFEGEVSSAQTLKVIRKLADLGVSEVSVGDTIGVANPKQVDELIGPALREVGADRIAVHFHDTRGTALANALRALELGVKCVDSSAGGLGGCPFAPGATGNLATEDLVYMLNGMGVRTGIDLRKLSSLSVEFAERIKIAVSSRYVQAYAASCD